MLFKDRADAGRRLARRLADQDLHRPVVLALPRGGVPVAAPVAAALDCPIVPFVARKIGAPGHAELGIGAVAEGEEHPVVLSAASRMGLSTEDLSTLARQEKMEIARQVDAFRGGQPLPDLKEHDVVVVDDGLATGVTAEAALRAVRRKRPHRLLFAVPVCAPDTAERLRPLADELICLAAPASFGAVGEWYERFEQTSDEEVRHIVGARDEEPPVDREEREISVELPGGQTLRGDLTVPEHAVAAVLFAHGSGSSRRSPRNRMVAGMLQDRGLATLLMDLLTEDEHAQDLRTGRLRFDIDLLAQRLQLSTDRLSQDPSAHGLPLGYFGASTGAAAALVATPACRGKVEAVVSRGGRPDLAGDHLDEVVAPTLLIVGSRDTTVLELNRQALARLGPASELAVVQGASHLFEEDGALEEVGELAAHWLLRHLT